MGETGVRRHDRTQTLRARAAARSLTGTMTSIGAALLLLGLVALTTATGLVLRARAGRVRRARGADLLTPAQCERLRDRTLDLRILRPPAVGEEIAVQTLDIEPLVLALPADHRLAAEPVIALADLRNEPFIGFADKDSIVNDVVLQRCRDAGFVPRREHDAPGTSVLLALVAAGLGVALVPGAVRALPLAGVKFRDVVDAGTIELALAWATAAETPVTAAVRTLILAEFHPANAALPTTASKKT